MAGCSRYDGWLQALLQLREVSKAAATATESSSVKVCVCCQPDGHRVRDLWKAESLTPSAPGRASGVNKATGFPIPYLLTDKSDTSLRAQASHPSRGHRHCSPDLAAQSETLLQHTSGVGLVFGTCICPLLARSGVQGKFLLPLAAFPLAALGG